MIRAGNIEIPWTEAVAAKAKAVQPVTYKSLSVPGGKLVELPRTFANEEIVARLNALAAAKKVEPGELILNAVLTLLAPR